MKQKSMDADGRKTILVIGYGEMGHAMETLLSEHHDLQFWDKRPLADKSAVDLDDAVAAAAFILFCVPVTPLGELVERISQNLSPGSISLSVAKGLDEQGRPAPRILADVYGDRHPFGVLYGPMIAEEIIRGRYAFGQAGCSSEAVWQSVRQLYAGTALKLEYSPDIEGIAWASLLKNVYAILFGAADELSLGDNVRGLLVVHAMQEIAQILRQVGGTPGTVHALAGLGDLVTTATSASSHHHEIGQQLACGVTGGLTGEGTHTLAMVERFKLFNTAACPVFRLVQAIVRDPATTRQRFREYLDKL